MLLLHFQSPFWFNFDVSSVLLMVAIPCLDDFTGTNICQNPIQAARVLALGKLHHESHRHSFFAVQPRRWANVGMR